MIATRIQPIRVCLVAPPMVCWGLERLVQTAQPWLEIAGTCAGATECLEGLEKNAPDVVVADLESQDELDLLVQAQTRSRAKLLLITSSSDCAVLDAAVLAGVRGVVKKSEPPAILLKAIEKVHEGELWIDRGATSRIFMEMARQKVALGNDPEKQRIASLTSREREAIVAVSSDAAAPAKVIAGRLCISEHTLRNHLSSIYSKLELSNRLDLYAFATRHRLNRNA